MGIVDEDIAKVRESADIVAVISEHVQLKRVGRRWSGLCPFHAEKSASFSVNQEQGLYYCFGCGAKGDVITFVRELEHLDFVGAVEKLAASVGMSLRYSDARQGEGRKHRQRLVEVMRQAVDFYHQRLLAGADAATARSYLRSRGFTSEEVRHFQIGWAPEGWEELVRALSAPRALLVEAGLAFENNRGRATDSFRARVMFPIFDPRGDPVAFGGRALPGASGPKYKNSTGSPIYDKSRVLYGLNWSKGEIVRADEAIVCEGYTDVIGFAAAEVPRAVATCGTALTEDHIRALRSYARRLVLAFDADAAGQQAAERVHEWEQRHQVDVAVAALPAGSDPGDLARSDPEALREAVRAAVPFLRFRVDRALQAADTSTAEGRARAATAAAEVIAEHPDPLVRDQYVMDVSSQLRLPAERLRERLAPGRRGGPRGRRVREDRPPAPPLRVSPELEALRLLISRPDEMAPSLHEVLFADPTCLAAYRALREAGGRVAQVADVDDEVVALLQRLAVEDTGAEPADVVDRLLEGAGRRALDDLAAQARNATEDDTLGLADTTRWLKRSLEALRDPDTESEAAMLLLTWLLRQHEECR